jgi:hypothetical protein
MKRLMMAALACACTGLLSHTAQAMTDAECAAEWSAADRNKDGFISVDEGARYYSALRIADKTVADGKLNQTDFMTNCRAGVFDKRNVDAGAPLKGANSFTEGQAKDRAVAHGYTNVSQLSKDSEGVWRGTAQLDGRSVKIAIDYKGNVVSQ